MNLKSIIFGVITSLVMAFGIQAVDTTIVVRVLAKDAKFIGTSMGGAEVIIRDANTQEILAEGVTVGGTGDTGLIMTMPRARSGSIVSTGSAHYTATIDIDKPRLIEVLARGPKSPNISSVTATSQQWVVPGKHVSEGDAWLIELRGLVVEVLDLEPEVVAGTLKLHAKVRMMCGCPTNPGGMWDSNQMEIMTILEKDGITLEVPMAFSGETSHFVATASVSKGSYTATFYAYQTETGNTGVVTRNIVVR